MLREAASENYSATHCRSIEHVWQTFGASECLTCRVLGQHHLNQRKVPHGRVNEKALTADIVALASQ